MIREFIFDFLMDCALWIEVDLSVITKLIPVELVLWSSIYTVCVLLN